MAPQTFQRDHHALPETSCSVTASRTDGKTHLVVIQPSSFCNIDCQYCYVPGRSNRATIASDVLEEVLAKVFNSDRVADGFRLVWHNGEPLAIGIDFYKEAVDIISRVNARDKSFHHCVQTNGTLINQEWVDFFAAHQIAPTISIDGPRHIHDASRVTRSGHGSFDATLRGVKILRDNGFRLVGLCVITATSLDHGKEIFNFFLDEGFSSLGLIIEEPWGGNPATSFTGLLKEDTNDALEQRFRSFISDFFDAWLPYRDRIEVREFGDLFSAFRKVKLDNSAFAQQEDATPCTVLSFDRDGGVTTFSPQMIAGTVDHPKRFVVANIRDLESLDQIDDSPVHQRLSREVDAGIRRCRSQCGYFNLCGGGAPASKFYEHGTFDCTETRECRFSKQLLADVLLEKVAGFSASPSSAPTTLEGCRQSPPLRVRFHRSHSRCVDGKLYIWDVERLWKLADGLPARPVKIDSILETDRDCWFSDIREPTIRNVAKHATRIKEADLSFPIILNADGALMDGGHRIAKAIMQGLEDILAVQFDQMPPPDAVEELKVVSGQRSG